MSPVITESVPNTLSPVGLLDERGLSFMMRLLQAWVAHLMPTGLDIEINLYPVRDADGTPTGRAGVQFVGYWPGIEEVDASLSLGPLEGEANDDAEQRAARIVRRLIDCGAPSDRIRIRRNEGPR